MKLSRRALVALSLLAVPTLASCSGETGGALSKASDGGGSTDASAAMSSAAASSVCGAGKSCDAPCSRRSMSSAPHSGRLRTTRFATDAQLRPAPKIPCATYNHFAGAAESLSVTRDNQRQLVVTLLCAFAICVLGGMTSFPGMVAAAMLIAAMVTPRESRTGAPMATNASSISLSAIAYPARHTLTSARSSSALDVIVRGARRASRPRY